MLVLKKVRSYERGLEFERGEFRRVVSPGWYAAFSPASSRSLDVVSMREGWLRHPSLDLIARSGALAGVAEVVDLAGHQRALVWMDDRFEGILGPGLYALWTTFRRVRVEVVDARQLQFSHSDQGLILGHATASTFLEQVTVPEGHVGLVYKDGELSARLAPGRYAFWRGMAELRVQVLELREVVLDVAGQEIMTADKVTVRLNAVVSFRVRDPEAAVRQVDDFRQALYRDAQLVLRAAVGTRELDQLLSDKASLSRELEESLSGRAAELGLQLVRVGVRDFILPGEMRELLNKVTEAKKAAEAALISRREETAAVRSQSNTAKLLENNPTLMRLRELETLERIADKAKLSVVMGEKGLDKIVNLL